MKKQILISILHENKAKTRGKGEVEMQAYVGGMTA